MEKKPLAEKKCICKPLSEKELIFTRRKNTQNSINKDSQDSFLKMGKSLNRNSTKEDVQIANKHMDWKLDIISHEGNTNENHKKHHHTPTGMAKIEGA